jgi:vacuolar iron transporter family protein
MSSDHFQGKSVPEHLIQARTKGAIASAETHGIELPGHIAAGADAAKDMAILFILVWILLKTTPLLWPALIPLAIGLTLWKAGRSAFLGWSRLERLHRLIEEERFEIEHHRSQEKEELTEIYRAKGFSGKLLEEVVAVLMADDNRLLKIMLEEELGLSLESYEHPLKQSAGAALGSVFTAGFGCLALAVYPAYGLPIAATLSLAIATGVASKLEKNRVLPSVVWTLSLAWLSCGAAFFISQLF